VITRLEKVYPVAIDDVDETVGLVDPTGPHVGSKVPEGFRLADPLERVARHRGHEFEHAQGELAVLADPILEVIDELSLE
jgi:hypothetical protein